MSGDAPLFNLSTADILAQLDRICSSVVFARASALKPLLQHLVNEAVAGESRAFLRERLYEDFGEPKLGLRDEESLSTYKKRLQERLDLYYASVSPGDLVRISMRTDTFRPEFSSIERVGPVVGRETDLQTFRDFYARRKDQLCIVSIGGVSGIGKTTLSEMILKEAMGMGRIEHVVSVQGPNDPRSVPPYLPFRDCVVGFVNEVGETAIQLRERVAPSWRSSEKQGIASELGAFLEGLTKGQRMVVFIDNFHLSDNSSEGFLSELARTSSRARLLVVVAFREFELSAREHPYAYAERRLELAGKLLRLRPGAVTISEIREFLQGSFPGNVFPPDLARLVAEYCEGIPLHLVNLVDHFERSEFSNKSGHWSLRRSPDEIAADLPSVTVHSMALPLVGLDETTRRLLSVAALLGERFESALLADIIGQDRGSVERALDVVYRTHRLIELAKQSSRENAYSASVRYRFSHSSYRDAFLARFDTLPSERTPAANRAINLLTVDAPIDSPTHAARIAGLLEAAGRIPEAVEQYGQSAKLSSMKFAHGTAAQLARRALHLLNQLPQDQSVRRSRMHLHILLGMAIMSTSGFAAPALEEIYRSLTREAVGLGDRVAEMIGVYGLWVFSIDSGRLEKALEYADVALTKANALGDTAGEVEAHYAKGTTLIQLGRFVEARSEFNSALADADSQSLKSHWFYQLDAAVSVRCQLARALWFLGEANEADSFVKRALAIAEEKGHPESRAYALVFLADLAHLRRDFVGALELSSRAISASVDCTASQELAWAQMVHAWALGHKDGQGEAALIELDHSFAFYKHLNARVALTKFHCLAAELYLRQKNPKQATNHLDVATNEVLETKEIYFQSELHRIRAEVLLAENTKASRRLARERLGQSYDLAAELHATPLQLRVALAMFYHRKAIGLTAAQTLSRLGEVCSSLPAGNNDPEVVKAKSIINS